MEGLDPTSHLSGSPDSLCSEDTYNGDTDDDVQSRSRDLDDPHEIVGETTNIVVNGILLARRTMLSGRRSKNLHCAAPARSTFNARYGRQITKFISEMQMGHSV